jgi:hypothetical protein
MACSLIARTGLGGMPGSTPTGVPRGRHPGHPSCPNKLNKPPFSSMVKQSALRRTAMINPKFLLKYDE